MIEKITLRLFIGMFFLGCLATTSAFGQSAWTYSDSWANAPTDAAEIDFTHTGEASEIYIVGAGVAEINPNSQLHEANIQVEIRSPQGRTEYGDGTWYQGSSGTSITVVVPLVFIGDDVGNYLTTTGFLEVCPYSPGILYSGSSLNIVQDGYNTIYYAYNRQEIYDRTYKTCYFRACIETDQNPANGCWDSTYEVFRDIIPQVEACSLGIQATYSRYRIPLIGYSFCARFGHSDLTFNPCPHGTL